VIDPLSDADPSSGLPSQEDTLPVSSEGDGLPVRADAEAGSPARPSARSSATSSEGAPPAGSSSSADQGHGALAAEILDELRGGLHGEVRADPLSRTLYATDASFYEMLPRAVVLPRSLEDVVHVVRVARKHGLSITARGAGTGLTGGALGAGLILDFTHFMHAIGPVDAAGRTVTIEPGVVLDHLNQHVAEFSLHFPVDVAPSNRASLGGMIANNSCGAHSIIWGRTVDHVRSLTMVMADGEVVEWTAPDVGPGSAEPRGPAGDATDRVKELTAGLARIRDAYKDEIRARFPRVLRSNAGYGLDRLSASGSSDEAAVGDAGSADAPDSSAPAGPTTAGIDPTNAINPIKVLCGSEGTLGIVVRATLALRPLPIGKSLVVLHFNDVFEAVAAVPAVLEHAPAAVELVDANIIEAARRNPQLAPDCALLEGTPAALLLVEFIRESAEVLATSHDQTRRIAPAEQQAEPLVAAAHDLGAYAVLHAATPADQARIWNIRKQGLGLLMSRPGDEQPYGFIEDAAVDPRRLPEYLRDLSALLHEEGATASFHAHASVGCIHVRPRLNLKHADDIARMQRLMDRVTDLAVTYGGTISGEHGDGLVRSASLERLYGPRIMQAFREVKQLFDPEGLLNPGKIVDAPPMTENLRFGPRFESTPLSTTFDFSRHGGMAGLAGMCSGVGLCRQRLVGSMCPSYMATGDEQHTTRARANALRVALSNRGLLSGLDDPHLADVMDLCISCKACQTECPTGVDMAKLKAEYLSHRNLREGVPARSRLIADMPQLARLASRVPRLANLVMQAPFVRRHLEKKYGLDQRVSPPRFARQTFRAWWRRHRRQRDAHPDTNRGEVVYFVDTWTNFFAPQVGIAAIKLLEAAGYFVRCPMTQCCGRPALSKGLLVEVRQLAESNVRILLGYARQGMPIIGTEPSCILTLVDEYPRLLPGSAARSVARHCMTIEEFLRDVLERRPDALRFRQPQAPLMFHGHCHQKALVGTDAVRELLAHAYGEQASEIASGCCGMAGSFGHEVEHYDVARAIGEERLFPAVRGRGSAEIAVEGFSCRQQIEHHTDARPRHIVEYLADLLDA
jgi:FAD/FMN-containing dehydrogenase/Fe-S oxidoreductase